MFAFVEDTDTTVRKKGTFSATIVVSSLRVNPGGKYLNDSSLST